LKKRSAALAIPLEAPSSLQQPWKSRTQQRKSANREMCSTQAVLCDSHDESHEVHSLPVIESKEEVSNKQCFATRSTMPELDGTSRTSFSGNQS
jgi:hypothetical protein